MIRSLDVELVADNHCSTLDFKFTWKELLFPTKKNISTSGNRKRHGQIYDEIFRHQWRLATKQQEVLGEKIQHLSENRDIPKCKTAVMLIRNM